MNRELHHYCVSCRHIVKDPKGYGYFCTRKQNIEMLDCKEFTKAGMFPVAAQFSCRFHLFPLATIKAEQAKRSARFKRLYSPEAVARRRSLGAKMAWKRRKAFKLIKAKTREKIQAAQRKQLKSKSNARKSL